MRRRTRDRYKELSEHAEVEDDPKKFQKLAGQINKILDAELAISKSAARRHISRSVLRRWVKLLRN